MKKVSLLALALCALPSAVSAATTELDCTDPTRSDDPHWSVVLNESEGTGTVAIGTTSYANKPAVFTANEVQIITKDSYFVDVPDKSIFYIDRTTLAWRWDTILNYKTIGSISGQCRVVTNQNRKI